jgi:DNA polymerase III subunit delta'
MVSPTPEIIIRNPTHLFVGPSGATKHAVVAALQSLLCTQKGCGYCVACQGIYAHSSAHLLWLEPENNYTRDAIEPIFDLLSLQRAEGDHFFIIIAQAERLQAATANALLKSLEEPPRGYHFILMTAHERLVLPTIRSRALVHSVVPSALHAVPDNQLYAHFVGSAPLNPVQFLQALDQLDLSDQESAELLDRIMQDLQRMIIEKRATALPVKTLHTRVTACMHAAAMLPQSGSSKIFWKNLYLKTISS